MAGDGFHCFHPVWKLTQFWLVSPFPNSLPQTTKIIPLQSEKMVHISMLITWRVTTNRKKKMQINMQNKQIFSLLVYLLTKNNSCGKIFWWQINRSFPYTDYGVFSSTLNHQHPLCVCLNNIWFCQSLMRTHIRSLALTCRARWARCVSLRLPSGLCGPCRCSSRRRSARWSAAPGPRSEGQPGRPGSWPAQAEWTCPEDGEGERSVVWG